ncbi:hypothetical protein [Hyphomonas sp.]|uniref:hypothetical protein n=1 Tax=Hyphomonas sp. TaxID=87 RepID=UPI000C8E795C|nr:hypothetical protein [Hyphomonas sp.]MAL46611.1 hypothetical protein [Hyphomonas sp.]
MTEENKEVIEEITEEQNEQPIEETIEEVIDETKFDSAGDPDVIKIDLDAVNDQQQEQEVVEEKDNNVEQVVEEVTEQPVMEEVTEEEKVEEVAEAVEEAVEEAVATGKPLPENIQKLVDFMDETGGDIQDYVNLNRDVSSMDDSDILDEYYRSKKSHLTAEERNFLLEEKFGIDEEIDDEKAIRSKKIALKEQVAEAKAYLDRQKSKYYEDIKAGSKLTQEQQDAINFYHKYNKDQESQKKLSEKSKRTFLNKTDSFFGQNFKGFEYNVGDKKYRFNVKDVDKVKKTQVDINNFVNKFVGDDKSTIEDAAGYHKSLYTAMNADAIAKHFYEQGKADAIKGQVAKDKNINLDPRKTHGETNVGGVKYKVLGQSSSELKNRSFKIRKRK